MPAPRIRCSALPGRSARPRHHRHLRLHLHHHRHHHRHRPPPGLTCSGGAITINDNGPATPYPANCVVSGLPGTITDVNLTLTGVSHTFPDDIDMLLVGPGGQNAIVMSDAGGSIDTVDVNLTLDDEAAAPLPDLGTLASGSFRPANYSDAGGDGYPPPAPTPSGNVNLSTFDGTAPNGTWRLFVVDDEADRRRHHRQLGPEHHRRAAAATSAATTSAATASAATTSAATTSASAAASAATATTSATATATATASACGSLPRPSRDRDDAQARPKPHHPRALPSGANTTSPFEAYRPSPKPEPTARRRATGRDASEPRHRSALSKDVFSRRPLDLKRRKL